VFGLENVTGGDGNDVLVGDAAANELSGGNGDDVLLGAGGDDVLSGGTGRDLLVGGSGRDTLSGNGLEDILVGARIIYLDEATGALDLTAFSAIMAEWTRTDLDTNERITHLEGTPGGLNGPYSLNAATVINDEEIDLLQGGGGADWFLIHLGDELVTGSGDVITLMP
jgi:Ca2+-binding RTX toxin-like protein